MALQAGLGVTYLANPWCNSLRGGGNGVTFTAPTTMQSKLHTAIAGASGTNAVSVGSATLVAVTSGAASNGATALSNSPLWTNGGTSETITDCSYWDQTPNFLFSGTLTVSKPWNSTDTLTLTSLAFSLGPLATT
jgi:hypothetical protein